MVCTAFTCFRGGFGRVCTDELRMMFDVVVETDLSNAAWSVDFYDGALRCGFAVTQPTSLAAGARTSMSTSLVVFANEEIPQVCPVPATTTRITVRLWDGPARHVLTREFCTHLHLCEAVTGRNPSAGSDPTSRGG